MRLNPRPPAVLVKELQSLSRHNSTYFIRAIFGLGASAALLLPVYFSSQPDYAIATISREVCQFFIWCQGILIALIVPVITASAIARERERDTLGILLMTAQGPLGIILSKLMARLFYILLLLATVLPAMLILASYGGLSSEDLLLGYLWTFTIGFACVGVSIALSAISSSIVAAIIGSYIVMFVLGFCAGFISAFTTHFFEFYQHRHLPFAVASTLIPFIANYEDMRSVLDYWPVTLLFSTFVFFIGTGLAVLLLPRGAAGRSRPLLTRVLAGYDRLMVWKGRWGRRIIHDRELGAHPLYWHEVHRRTTARNSFQIRFFYLVILFPLSFVIFLQLVDMDFSNDVAMPALSFMMALLIGGVGIGSAVSFIRERGQGNFNALLSAPISPWSIVAAKSAGILKSLLALSLVALYFVACVIWSVLHVRNYRDFYTDLLDVRSSGLIALALIFVCFLLLLIGTAVSGFTASLRASSTLIALARTFGSLPISAGIAFLFPGVVALALNVRQTTSLAERVDLLLKPMERAIEYFTYWRYDCILEALIFTFVLAALTVFKICIFAWKYPIWLYDERST